MESIAALEISDVRFAETVDVVVVGLGVAGSSAVLAARRSGADVLAVERGVTPGGTSANSGGLIYLGGGTALQRDCGYLDSPENMAAFLRAALGPGVDDDRVDVYCERSADHFDWLVSVGVPFRAAFCEEPNRESADDAGLLFSGGEDTYPYDEIAIPVPRGHKPQYIDSAGGFLMERLGAAVSASGARIVVDTRAETLVVDGGEVVGVRVQSDEGAAHDSGSGRGGPGQRRIHPQRRRWSRSSAPQPTFRIRPGASVRRLTTAVGSVWASEPEPRPSDSGPSSARSPSGHRTGWLAGF